MRKMTLTHVDAISHCETYVRPVIVPNMSPHHRAAIERDIELLTEIKHYLLKQIYEPGLPMSPMDPFPEKPNGDPSRSDNVG